MKAVARGRVWYERVLEGKSSDQRSLTIHAGVTERYVGLVFGCAFLAPDIVEAILEGRQPRDLTFKKLCSNVPLSGLNSDVSSVSPAVDAISLGLMFEVKANLTLEFELYNLMVLLRWDKFVDTVSFILYLS